MPSQIELIQEARRRGILPADKQPLFDEAVRRGLIQDESPKAQAASVVSPKTIGDPSLVQPEAKNRSPIIEGPLGASSQGIGQGISARFGDEIIAGVATPFRAAGRAVTGADEGMGFLDRISTAYNLELENQRRIIGEAAADNPNADLAGEVAGGSVLGGGVAKGTTSLLGAAKPTLLSLGARGTAEGATIGALFGFGGGEGFEDRFAKAKTGAVIGGVTGGIVGGAAGRQAQRIANKTIKTVAKLKTDKDAAYALAESMGVRVNMRQFADRLQSEMMRRGVNLGQHKHSSGALGAFVKNAGDDVSLANVDLMRRNFLDAAMDGKPSDARMAGKMINKLDDFIDGLPGGAEWQAARKAHKLFRKSETITRLMKRAKLRASQFSQGGMDNAIQVEFRQLARNEQLMKGFTKAEQRALTEISVDGVSHKLLRQMGKLAPTNVGIATILHSITVAYNMPLAFTLMAAGEISKRGSTALRQSSVNRASRLIRSEGNLPQPQRLTGPARSLVGSTLGATQPISSR